MAEAYERDTSWWTRHPANPANPANPEILKSSNPQIS
jgi:hypothetical protein